MRDSFCVQHPCMWLVLAIVSLFHPNRTFADESSLFGMPKILATSGGFSRLIALGDLNHDGNLDIVLGSAGSSVSSDGFITIFLGNGDGTFQSPRQYGAGKSPAFVLTDVDGDGNLDVVAVNSPPDPIQVFLGKGDGTLKSPIDSALSADVFNVVAADFDEDGRLDLAGTFQVVSFPPLVISNFAAVSKGNGDGTFQPWQPLSSSRSYLNYVDLVAADFNADSHTDVAVVEHNWGRVDTFLGDGSASFSLSSMFNTGHARSVTAADLNGDGYIDLAVTTDTLLRVAYGNGDGTFQTPIGLATYPPFPDPKQVITGDFDGDQRLDVAVALGSNDLLAVYINKPSGRFARRLFTAPNGPVLLATGDLNHDGHLDIVTANDTISSVSVFLNEGATSSVP